MHMKKKMKCILAMGILIFAFHPSHTFCHKYIERWRIFNFQWNIIPYNRSRILIKLLFGFGIKNLCDTERKLEQE